MKPPFVYFIRPVGLEGPVKIGCSTVVASRLENLMAWAPVSLEIVATIPGNFTLERRIHGVFAEFHSHHEWFHRSPRLTALIRDLAAGIPLGELIDLDAPLAKFRTRNLSSYTPDRRLYLSFAARMRLATKKARDASHPNWWEPFDIVDVLHRWCHGTTPTSVQIARLNEVIADPAAHCLTREQRWPKARAA